VLREISLRLEAVVRGEEGMEKIQNKYNLRIILGAQEKTQLT
jgi:hypothetical protein